MAMPFQPKLAAALRAARRFSLVFGHVAGVPGLLTVALVIASAVVVLRLEPQSRQRSIRLERDLRAASARPAPSAPEQPSTPAIALETLPPLSNNASDLERLFALAEANGINTQKADYRLNPVPATPYLAYEVRLPVSAQYPNLRKFAAEAITGMPNLAIDGIRFSREESTSETLSAELRVILFYRS